MAHVAPREPPNTMESPKLRMKGQCLAASPERKGQRKRSLLCVLWNGCACFDSGKVGGPDGPTNPTSGESMKADLPQRLSR
mmetsp:Transcript_18314/g.31726  ORF Transcript_18314/g.31726 Transcript_18314/m.31726 type:complete len:81 (-) Transcript_18314:3-245(-)